MGKSVMVWPVIGSRQEGDIFRAVLSASKSKCLPINTCNYLEYSAKDAHECCIKELRYYMSKNEIKNTRKKLRIYINRSGEVFWLRKHNCLEYRERLPTGVVKESTTWMELKSREKPRLCKDRIGGALWLDKYWLININSLCYCAHTGWSLFETRKQILSYR